MEQLIKFIEQRYAMCDHGDHQSHLAYFHQAFGSAEFYAQEHPEQEEEVRILWEEWRIKFVLKIYDQGLAANPSPSKERRIHMEKLIKFFEECFENCQKKTAYDSQMRAFHHAAGAYKFYKLEHPEQEEELRPIWEEWREKFISAILD